MSASGKAESMPRRRRCVIPSIISTTSISKTLPKSGGAVASSPLGCWTSRPPPCFRTLRFRRSRGESRIRVKAAGRSKPPLTRQYRHQCLPRLYMNGSALEAMRSSPTRSSPRCATNSVDTERSPGILNRLDVCPSVFQAGGDPGDRHGHYISSRRRHRPA